jgi:integrase
MKKSELPVNVCRYKGQADRFFGKYREPLHGRWVKIPGGPFGTNINTPARALKCAQEWYRAEILGKSAAERARPTITTWKDACDAYLVEVKARLRGAPATKDEDSKKAALLSRNYLLGTKPLALHDEGLALQWFRLFAAEKIARPKGTVGVRDPLTLRNYIKVMRAIYGFARRTKEVPVGWVNPAEGEDFCAELKALMDRKARREVMVPPVDLARLLALPSLTAEQRIRLTCAAYTGLRPGELHGLKKCDLVWEPIPHLKVVRQYTLSRGKIPAAFGPLKNKWSARQMPCHPVLASALREWVDRGWAAYVGRPMKPDDVLFPGEDGLPYRQERADVFVGLLEAAECSTTYGGILLTPYSVRHTFSTTMKQAGIEAEDRDYLMGHSPKTTRARNYDVNDLPYLHRQLKKLPTFTEEGLRVFEANLRERWRREEQEGS